MTPLVNENGPHGWRRSDGQKPRALSAWSEGSRGSTASIYRIGNRRDTALARTILRRVQWNGLLVGNRVRDQPHLFGIKARRGTMKVGVAPKAVPIDREDLLGVDGASLPDL